MKRSRFTEPQIIEVLPEADAGAKMADLRRQGVSAAALYNWVAKNGGMEGSETKRLRALEDESRQLKRLLADVMLDNTGLTRGAAQPTICSSVNRDRFIVPSFSQGPDSNCKWR